MGLLLGGVAVVFALENVTAVTVTFFQWQITSSLAAVLIVSLLGGILIAVLMLLPESLSGYFKSRKLKKEILTLKEELRKQKELTTFAKTTPPTAENIAHIENGAIEH